MKNKYAKLKYIAPDIQDAFDMFYNTMLSDVRLSSFFESDAQIQSLIDKQKKFFLEAFELDVDQIEKSYIKIGEMHYDMRIPYVDYMKGMEILQEHFLLYSASIEDSAEIMREIFSYFRFIKSKTAQGYLNKMLESDEHDIQLFLQNITTINDEFDKKIVLNRINWLNTLILSIKNSIVLDTKTNDTEFKEWIERATFIDMEKKLFFEDLEKRININTQNLFYFLENGNYLEMLPLYESLQNIYKLTLILSNSVSLTVADDLVKNLKIDSLTHLYRKDAFNTFLEKELFFLKRSNSYFSVVYIDLDKFKYINDTYGHWSGDKVLEKIGELINSNIRESDIGFRNGGDEFAIILKQANEEQASKICEKIYQEFSSCNFMHNEKTFFNVSLSYGVFVCDESTKDMNITDVIEAVDQRLYKAKNKN
ncbi:diguanylate cyclase [bacterium]|nr:diguanylate cyclase [bacterium]MBU1990383.1 diguanylate cyclase [bacterium]